MQPKRFSELPEVTVSDGTEYVPVVKNGSSRRLKLANLPVSAAVQAAINALNSTDKPIAYLIKAGDGAIVKITVDGDSPNYSLRTTLYNPATDNQAFAFGLLGVGIFQ